MARSKKLTHAARVLRVREMLDSRPFVTVRELMQEFGVSRKTVYNDFSALQQAGVPLYSDKGPANEARWMLSRAARKKTITLAAGQVVPLGLARMALSFLAGTEVHDQLAAVMDKLAEGAHPKTKNHLAELSRKVAVIPHGPKSYRKKVDVLDDLLTSLLYDEVVQIRYRSPGGKLTRHVVEPLTLALYREALYLIADSRTFDGLRISFAVDRITSSHRRKGERFTYPGDYDPAQALDGAFGLVGGETEEVEVIFEEWQSRYVRERHWHPTQKFKKLPDGRVRMTMTVSGTQDVLLWLLGHTGTFEVIAPASLRKKVKETLKKAAALHRSPSSKTSAR